MRGKVVTIKTTLQLECFLLVLTLQVIGQSWHSTMVERLLSAILLVRPPSLQLCNNNCATAMGAQVLSIVHLNQILQFLSKILSSPEAKRKFITYLPLFVSIRQQSC